MAATLRNVQYVEHGLLHSEVGFEWYDDQGYVGEVETIDTDGRVRIPGGPGTGVEIDWDFVEERGTDRTRIDASSTTDSFHRGHGLTVAALRPSIGDHILV